MSPWCGINFLHDGTALIAKVNPAKLVQVYEGLNLQMRKEKKSVHFGTDPAHLTYSLTASQPHNHIERDWTVLEIWAHTCLSRKIFGRAKPD